MKRRKVVPSRARRRYPVEQVAKVNESEGLRLREASSSTTGLPWSTGRPKMGMYLGLRGQIARSNHPTQIPAPREAATYGQQSINLRNEVTRCRLSACPEFIEGLRLSR